MNTTTEYITKALFYITGGLVAFFTPIIPYIIVVTFAVLVDCFTAWQAGRRVAKKFPDKADGKFSSSKAKKVGWTLIRVYLLIILCFAVEDTILEGYHIFLPNIVAGAIVLGQFFSILENYATCGEGRWAKWLQTLFKSKIERHFNVDIDGDGKIGDEKPKRKKKQEVVECVDEGE